jgi:hypothetical protein
MSFRLALPLMLLASGCAAALKYNERWKPDAPLPRVVNLEVVDARPEDQGGKDPQQVGIVRGGYGNPAAFLAEDRGLPIEMVRRALVDALHGAGVDTSLKAPMTLRAKLTRYWMDGYVGYAATVEVDLGLFTADETLVWTQKVIGNEAGAVFSYGAASALLNTALEHLASDANARFREDGFQRALGQ